MRVTLSQLKSIYRQTPNSTLEKYIDSINDVLPEHDIDTKGRVAMFLAQIGHESGGLKWTEENLNYGWTGLRKVFSKYFPNTAIAKRYERKKQAIANRVYANRMGNGPESSGDGWRYRGRGAIQITGHNNYESIREAYHFNTMDECIEWMSTPDGIIGSAAWYWTKNRLNRFADRGDLKTCTRMINGGYNGLSDRQTLYKRALAVL